MTFESAEDLRWLQDLMDRSMAGANAHLRSIYEHAKPVTAEDLVAELTGMQVVDLATVTAKGEPRVSPVDAHFLWGRWLFGTSPEAARAKHLAKRPAVSAAHTRGEGFCVITHGHVQRVDFASERGEEVLAYLRSAYPNYDDWASPDNPYWFIEPTHLFARGDMIMDS
jgi:uncharacterized pyridoxamine 5'-phosphate oxidase family protein